MGARGDVTIAQEKIDKGKQDITARLNAAKASVANSIALQPMKAKALLNELKGKFKVVQGMAISDGNKHIEKEADAQTAKLKELTDVSIGRLQKQALRGQEAYEKTKEKYDNLASAVDALAARFGTVSSEADAVQTAAEQ